jgi:hypothetical protein
MAATTRALPPHLVSPHRRYNEQAALAWERFAPHRERITGLVIGAGGGRLAVLGAGNCNDLDLAALGHRFSEIHLVDLDGAALDRAARDKPTEASQRLRLHAPVDVTAALPELARRGSRRPIAPGELERLSAASTTRPPLPLGTFDVVLSPCLITQLAHSCRLALGREHPALPDVVEAVALGHLRLLCSLLAPPGTAVLVTDTTSSHTFPLDELYTAFDPTALLRHLAAAGNTATGTNLEQLEAWLAHDRVLASLVERPKLVPPWLWRMSEEVTCLVYALELRRRATV